MQQTYRRCLLSASRVLVQITECRLQIAVPAAYRRVYWPVLLGDWFYYLAHRTDWVYKIRIRSDQTDRAGIVFDANVSQAGALASPGRGLEEGLEVNGSASS